MYPNGYYTWIDTSECLAYTQSQLHETTAPSALRAPPSSKEAEKVPPSRGGENYEEKEGGVIDWVSSCEFLNALIQIEDKNFYSHWGVNLPAKLRAIVDNLAGKKVSGGSTITEQYVKNKYFPSAKRSYLQKAREAVLAVYFTISSPSKRDQGELNEVQEKDALGWISEGQREFSWKDHILNLYYHDAYFGNQLYGVGAAIEVYFGKEHLEDLTQEEITILISLIHNPGIETLEESYFQEYFEQVKNRLGYEFERTYFWKLPKKENRDEFPFVTLNHQKLPLNSDHSLLPLYEGEQKGASFVEGGSWARAKTEGVVARWTQTSIDSALQSYARDILQNTLKELAGKNVTNGAIFAMNPNTGEVLIYQGSKDFYAQDIDGQVDVITSLRQPGSTMKPFLYLMALQSGANPDDLIIDMESEYNSFKEGSVYISENYSLREYGLVRLKKALGNSFNNASVRLAKELGLEKVYLFYKDYGFQLPFPAEHYGYSLVLGNPSITLEQLVRSYAKLLPQTPPPASAGIHPRVSLSWTSINSPWPLFEEEQTKASFEEGGGWTIVKSEGVAAKFLLYDILSDPDNRDISFGVNSILNTSIAQAVKTGTSSDFRDNLVISYHPDFVLGVWVGNNDNSSMQGVTGITGAGYIWHQVIEKAIELWYITDKKIPIPEGIELSQYCLDEKCFRKENTYSQGEVEYFSRPAEWIYRKEDMFEKLSSYELSRLNELWVDLK